MQKLDSGIISLSGDEAKEICKLGQGPPCCIWLTCGANGFECSFDYPPIAKGIEKMSKLGQMTAKGKGAWPGCPYENKLEN